MMVSTDMAGGRRLAPASPRASCEDDGDEAGDRGDD